MYEIRTLRRLFADLYPEAGDPVIYRAPGRVNLIGEHTDYNGLPVLPMTINKDIRIAAAARDDEVVRLRNADKAFPDREFQNGRDIPPSETGSWENYCKAAVHAVNRYFA
ncbi:MAG TPA: hypothetical protein ENN80_03725, partial [Candidatus Hydrogenedentes bacterium]|nr:hypothetical protein [Candidatus Hydrogenedentota bacterium]